MPQAESNPLNFELPQTRLCVEGAFPFSNKDPKMVKLKISFPLPVGQWPVVLVICSMKGLANQFGTLSQFMKQHMFSSQITYISGGFPIPRCFKVRWPSTGQGWHL
jgi:hypothetical protein